MSPLIRRFGLDRLSHEDRLSLAQALWDSVADEQNSLPIDPEVRAEIERRASLSDADPSRGIPWETVRAEARARWEP